MTLKDDNELKEFIDNTNYRSINTEDYTIEDYISDVDEHIHFLKTEIDRIHIARNTMETFCVEYKKESADASINRLTDELNEFEQHKDKIKKVLLMKQDECEHEVTCIGHDSHYEYFICYFCGFKESY